MEEVQITHWLKMAKTLVPNERFGAMAGVVLIQAVVYRTTVSVSLNGVQLSRHFAKPRGVVCNFGTTYHRKKKL